MKTLGIIGVGQLAHYFVSGLRHGNDNRPILLSPRGSEMAQVISSKFNATIAHCNQDVVDQSDIILLATRPDNAAEALHSLTLTENHTVISVVAGFDMKALQSTGSSAHFVRSLPVFSAEICAGAVPLFPHNTDAYNLLTTIGEVVVLPTEDQFDTACVMGCTFSWFFRIYGQLQLWLENEGIASDKARTLALQCAHGVSTLALEKPQIDLNEMASEIARPGTFSLAGEHVLKDEGGLKALTLACDLINKKLKENS